MYDHTTPPSVSNNDRTHLTESTTEERPLVKMLPEVVPNLIRLVGVTGFAITAVIVADAVQHPERMTDDYHVSKMTVGDIENACGITGAMCHRAIARLLDNGVIWSVDGEWRVGRVRS